MNVCVWEQTFAAKKKIGNMGSKPPFAAPCTKVLSGLFTSICQQGLLARLCSVAACPVRAPEL